MKCKQCGTEYKALRSTSQYCSAACRVKANRVSVTDEPETLSVTEGSVTSDLLALPGDDDYQGCCKQVDGAWQVDNTKPSVKDLSDDELIRRLHYIKDWKQSPEHKERLRRRQVVV